MGGNAGSWSRSLCKWCRIHWYLRGTRLSEGIKANISIYDRAVCGVDTENMNAAGMASWDHTKGGGGI